MSESETPEPEHASDRETLAGTDRADVTRLLSEWRAGRPGALAELMPIVHDELRRIAERQMSNERLEHTLQATALVNEAFIKLAGNAQINWKDRSHFFAMTSSLMRRVLVDHARAQRAEKRGGSGSRIHLDLDHLARDGPGPGRLDLLDLESALEELACLDRDKAEIVELRYFGGLTFDEIGRMRETTTKRAWTDCQFAQAWLLRHIAGSEG